MRNTILLLMATAALSAGAANVTPFDLNKDFGAVLVKEASLTRTAEALKGKVTLDLSTVKVSTNKAILLTPVLVNEADTLQSNSAKMSSVGIYGRTRYYYYQRNSGDEMLSGTDELSYISGQQPETVTLTKTFDWEPWMDGAELVVLAREYSCCHNIIDSDMASVAEYYEPDLSMPTLVFMTPAQSGPKARALNGRAYVDFVVNRTEIREDYRRNSVELARIRATIDSVRNDDDITINAVHLKGYASPESPYSHNTKLARGRVAAVKDYIQNYYHFNSGVITTEYEPEDWDGLRRFVETSSLEHRSEILDIIDRDMDPDAKEAQIKSSYPSEYSYLLQESYPALRHTDYVIDYTIREFTDIEEIKRLVNEDPSKLDLYEFNRAAASYTPGTDEYNNVFETAARMYPSDETANLNAANSRLQAGDYSGAAYYLDKAGTSAEADYARGVLQFCQGHYSQAIPLLEAAEAGGVSEATETLSRTRELLTLLGDK